MPDQLEQSLREALSHRAAQLDPDSIARLGAIDYHPRRRRLGKLPAVGALGATGVAAAVAAIVALGSSAAPAFAGWQSTPTTPAPGQLAQAATGLWAGPRKPGPDRLARSVHGLDLRRLDHQRRMPQRQRGLDVVQVHLVGAAPALRRVRSSSVAAARATPPATR